MLTKNQRFPGATAVSVTLRTSAYRPRKRLRSSSVGRMMLDQNTTLIGLAERVLICESKRLRRRLKICAAMSLADWLRLLAWRCSLSRVFFCRVNALRCWVRLGGSLTCTGPSTLSWSSRCSRSRICLAARVSACFCTCKAAWRKVESRSSLALPVTFWRIRSSWSLRSCTLASSASSGTLRGSLIGEGAACARLGNVAHSISRANSPVKNGSW